MKTSMTSLLSFILVAGSASAKTVFSALSVDGKDFGHGVGVRVPSSNTAITDISSPNLICNTGFVQPVSNTIIPVKVGSKVTASFHHTSAGYTGPDPSDPIDPGNKGPVVAYLAAIPSATQASVTGLKWFKIWEDGWNSENFQWGSDHLFANKGNATFTIPSCLQGGDYLLRVEAIALQSATRYPGAQFYMSCAQIHIDGAPAADVFAPETVPFPGAYSSTDPGIVTSIFGLGSYEVPGPAVFDCT